MTININATPSDQASIDSQWLFTPSDLDDTPTVLAKLMKPDEERKNRRKGVSLIYKVAEKISLYMATHLVSTAALFFHRFFMRRLMRPVGCASVWQGQPTFAYQDVALSALYLATKVEECYKRLDDIVSAGLELDSRIDQGVSAGGGTSSDRESEESILRQSILWGEERLLETLCFDLIIDHPQKHLILAAKKLAVDRGLTRIAYAHIHDAFRDPVCTMFEPPVLAAGAFALACQDVDVDPTEFSTGGGDNSIASTSTLQGWLQVFDVSQEEVDDCTTALKEVRDAMLLTEPRAAIKTGSGFNSSTSTPHPHRQPQPQAQNGLGPYSSTNSPFPALPSSSAATSRVGTPSAAAAMPPPGVVQQQPSRPPSRHGHAAGAAAVAAANQNKPFAGAGANDNASYTLKSPAASANATTAYTLKSPSASIATTNYTLKSPGAGPTELAEKSPNKNPTTNYTLTSPRADTTTVKSSSAAAATTTGFTLKSPTYMLKSPALTGGDVKSQPSYTLKSPASASAPHPAEEEAARKVALEQKQTERAERNGDVQEDEGEEGEICD